MSAKGSIMKKLSEESKEKLLYIIIITLTIILLSRLLYLQVLKGDSYLEQSKYNSVRMEDLQPIRGKILDRNGVVLAENLPSYDLEIVTEDLQDKDRELTFLSSIIEMEKQDIENIIKKANLPIYAHIKIKGGLTEKEVIQIKEHSFELPGITVSTTSKRYYPFKNTAAPIIGFIGPPTKEDLEKDSFYGPNFIIGKQGIEAEYEKLLRGEKGKEVVQVDASGRIRDVLDSMPSEPGNNIYLTIDIMLQEELETIIGDRKGVAIAIDPNNGEILAMVSHPSFDPNLFVSGISQQALDKLYAENAFINRAVQGQYPPGSTFKPITLISALNEEIITTKSVIYCRNSIVVGNRRFKDWIYPSAFGYQNPVQAIANSSDVFFYTIGLKTGVEKIVKYAKLFGLGDKTWVDLPTENTGLVPSMQWKQEYVGENWYPGDTANLSIGQGYLLVTPLQMAIMYSGIAKNGIEYTPHFFLKATSQEGSIVEEFTNSILRKIDINNEVLDTVRDGMEALTNKPDMKILSAYGGNVCAKTGTAEVGETEVNHWLIAFAPHKKPEIVGLLFFEHSDFPSSHALAPLMSDLLKKFFSIKSK
ncbi:MAG: penicillin-binding protein 2 [Caldiserica bacterium]|nr:MAG: penicillin-binding protein 2 [Caldisericota bacterium]